MVLFKSVSPLALLFALSTPVLAQSTVTSLAPLPAETATTATCPLITRLQALSASTFLLKWSDQSGASEFRVYRDHQLVATLGADVREWKDTGLTPATVYSYALAAVINGVEIASPVVADITRIPNETDKQTRVTYDVVVTGATPGGIAAALTAARLGDKVALVSASPWIGGMMTGGLSRTDFGSMKSAGGIFKEFADRVLRYYTTTYGPGSPQVKASRDGYYFEPRVAKWIFHQMLAEQPNITLMLNHYSQDVLKKGNRVTDLLVLDRPRMIRKVLSAKVFIDATYEGDLAAQAGAAYRIGREDKTEFNEEHAGQLFWEPNQRKVQFGSGAGDRKVQAYNYRLCLTKNPEDRYPFPTPYQYDRTRYLSLLPDIKSGRLKNMEQVLSILPLPDGKFDANNHPLGNPSSDLIGGADTYPESDLWEREPLAEAHRQHILGLLYFVQNDFEVPAAFRLEASQWGFAYDEFLDNDRVPTQLYVREGRRIRGAYTFTENDARSVSPDRRPNAQFDSVGVADYPIDSHGTTPEKDGLLEGFFYLPGSQTQPSQVPYRVMTPLGVEGVLVSVCVSCSHIGYGTLRMEPVFLSLGTAAGVAAHLAVKNNVLPSQIDTDTLQSQLLAQKHVICVFHDVPLDHPNWAALQYFGTKGFLPYFDAKPDVIMTRGEAAQWLWQWMQTQKPELRPSIGDAGSYSDLKPDNPNFVAIHSLRERQIVPSTADFNPNAQLTTSEAARWVKLAFDILKPPAPAKALSVAEKAQVADEAAGFVTRGQWCQRLYEAETQPRYAVNVK